MWRKLKKSVQPGSRTKLRNWRLFLYVLASALLVISPSAGLAAFLILCVLTMHRIFEEQAYRLWTLLWGGTLLLLLPSLVTHRNFTFVPQLLLGYGASLLLVAKPRAVKTGLSLVLITALFFGLAQRYASSNLWLDSERSASLYELLSRTSVLNKKASPDLGKPWISTKTWALPKQEDLVLSFDVRLSQGETGSDWYSYNSAFKMQEMSEKDESFLRVYPPSSQGDNRFITREINTGAPLANRTFRTHVELRSSEPFMGRGCQGVRIQVVAGNGAGRCRDIRLNDTWRTYEFDWTAPPETMSPAIRLSLYNIDVASYDVRGSILEELKDGLWQPLNPLEPEGFLVRLLPAHRALAPRIQVIPTHEWQRVSFPIAATEVTEGKVSFLTQVESGIEVSIKHLQLKSAGSAQPTPLASVRQSLWFLHANTAGHSLVAVGLVLISLVGFKESLLYIGIISLSVLLTGSRAALLALVLGIALYSLLNVKMWRSKVFWSLVGSIFVVVVGAFLLEGRLNIFSQNINRVSRFAIWKVAWETFLAHPWIGMGSEDIFMETWRSVSGSEEPIAHAHNIWLQFAATYGSSGLMAMLWFASGIVYLAWRWGRLRGLLLAIPILSMNVFDYTLFSATVLFPLLLGLNTLGLGESFTADNDSRSSIFGKPS